MVKVTIDVTPEVFTTLSVAVVTAREYLRQCGTILEGSGVYEKYADNLDEAQGLYDNALLSLTQGRVVDANDEDKARIVRTTERLGALFSDVMHATYVQQEAQKNASKGKFSVVAFPNPNNKPE